MNAEEQRAWMEQWRRAGPALKAQRRQELRAMSEADALAACETLLSLVAVAPSTPTD